MFLPDVNVWIALAFVTHIHHTIAQGWFDTLPSGTFFFCRMTQQGFLRLATDPRVLLSEAVTLPAAWQMYDTILEDTRVFFAHEPVGVEPAWRGYTQSKTFTPKVWNDAFLAAFAQAGGYELVTLDKGFTRYPNLKCTILS
jgi:toxin-antitoxin system PIN domain toxin